MNTFYLGWKNLRSKPLSLVLTLLIFSFGVGLISFSILLSQQVITGFNKNGANIDIVVAANGSPLQAILCNVYHIDNPTGNILLEDAEKIQKLPTIESSYKISLGDTYNSYRIIGVERNFPALYNAQLREGIAFQKDFDACIGSDVAKKLNLKIGDTFHSEHGLINGEHGHHHHEHTFTVTGIYSATNTIFDKLICTTIPSYWQLHEGHNHEREHPKEISALLIKSKGPLGLLTIPNFVRTNTKLMAARPTIETNKLYELIGIGKESLFIIAYILIGVSGFSIFISLWNSIKERKYEIAILKTLGSSKSKILIMVLAEGLISGFLGTTLGLLIAHIGLNIFGEYSASNSPYSFTGMVFEPIEWYIILATLCLSFIASIIPAFVAMNANIHQTLTKN